MTSTISKQKPALPEAESAQTNPSVRAFLTRSGIEVPVEPFTAETLRGWDPGQKLGEPGKYPYTRGIYADMYRKRPWTIRHNAGFGSGEDTNALFKGLFKNGLTGLNLAIDLPSQMGVEPDDPRGQTEVGRVGVALSTLEDMERLFDGIPLDQVSTSTAINGMTIVFLAQYVLAAERQGVPLSAIRGTLQNDILKEYLSRGTYIFPPRPSIRLTGDVIEWCIKNAPKFNPISVSAGHMQQAGATHIQCFAYAFANAQVYLDEVIRRGYSVDQVAPLFSFLGQSTVYFFEAAANHRAARRLWASILKEKYGAKDPRSWMLRMATAGDQLELTAVQPLNNLARITLQCLGAALGGTQSVILAAYDEALGLPTAESFRATLMAQNIVQRESGVADVVDPLAGSYYVEWLTDRLEQEMRAILQKIADAGGMVKAIEEGVIQRSMAREGYEEERRIQNGQLARVGVNCLVVEEEEGMKQKAFRFDPDIGRRHIERLKEIRRERDQDSLTKSLKGLKKAAADESQNLVPYVMEAVRCMATGGEIAGVLREVFGTYKPPSGV